MAKKNKGVLVGLGVVLGGAICGAAKYLKDYGNVDFTNDDEVDEIKKNSTDVKNAAKRTYVAIKDKSGMDEVKNAAGEMAKSTGHVLKNSATIAKTAGTKAVEGVKGLKLKYDEDPDAAKEETIDNLKDMGYGIANKAMSVADSVMDNFRSNKDDEDDDIKISDDPEYSTESFQSFDEEDDDKDELETAEENNDEQ